MGKKLTTEEFIEKAKKIHGDKYDYSKVFYEGGIKPVIFTCPFHVDIQFVQAAYHLEGYGCIKCLQDLLISITTPEDFIKLSEQKFKNQFDYKNVNLSDVLKGKVKLTCTKCKTNFETSVRNHFTKSTGNCLECVSSRTVVPYTEETLKLKMDELNLNSELISFDFNSKVRKYHTIKCKSCGNVFKQRQDFLLSGVGCPSCTKHGFQEGKKAVLYIYEITGREEFTGFGISGSLKSRNYIHFRNLELSGCYIKNSHILCFEEGKVAKQLEKFIKTTIKCGVSNIEGFKTESTNLSKDVLKSICEKWLADNTVSYYLLSDRE